MPDSNVEIYCDVSEERTRPYLTPGFRKIAFDITHKLSHPGALTTAKLVASRFFIPKMKSQIVKWSRCCMACQRVKVNRPTGQFAESSLFEHVHIDIGGHLPPFDGKQYIIKITNRSTPCPEAIPVNNISAKTVAKVFTQHWVVRFGTPARLTTDQGRQFESDFFVRLTRILGTQKLRTNPYHPQANSRIERWHRRSLKAAIIAYALER